MFKRIPAGTKADPDVLIKAHKRFEWLTSFVVVEFRLIHHVLSMMTKNPVLGFNTMGVKVSAEGGFQLYYDPLWMSYLTDAELTYIFYHEILHLVLHHCTRRPLTTDPKEHHIANIAHDLAVNELIPENSSCQPPRDEKGALAGTFVSELKKQKEYADIKEKQTSEWYWDYLQSKKKENGGKLPGIDEGGECNGDCANCKMEKGDGSGGGVLPKKGCKHMDNHEGWGEDEIADERVAAKVKEIDSNNMWGNESQGVKEIILAAQIRKINWRSKIRVWAGNHVWPNRRTTRKKPNRRTGFQHPGYRKDYVDKYLVAADTSGSIDSVLAGEFLTVVNQLIEYLPVDFMMFDCEIQTQPKPFERRSVKLEFKGRGGTDFQPIIDLVDQRHYKGLLILTDGEASAPSRPKSAHVLWVLPEGHKPPVDWGDRVFMQKNA